MKLFTLLVLALCMLLLSLPIQSKILIQALLLLCLLLVGIGLYKAIIQPCSDKDDDGN
ncbi:hypothetical protein [Shewanella canadensis]|uniref:hypothetical protein n=1 Tax=Shewanella canadensis TaxID=271096 RepID=UPI00163B26E5|nr:hypothetical protein [Shewanella canadensis]